MSEKLYLLTETEMRSFETDARNAESWGLPDSLVDLLTPLSPDWKNAPEWATKALISTVFYDGRAVLSRIGVAITPWIPRPKEDSDGA